MKKVKLCEIGKIITGYTPSTKKEEYYSNNDFMFVGPSDIKSVMYVDSTEKRISTVAFNEYKNKFINENSIVVDCIGSDMGNVAIIKNKCLTNQQINAITNINCNDYNIKYIYYVLSTMKQYFHLIGTNGSTMPILNKTMFENVEIEVPEKEIQDKIANILSKLDDKIKLNNEINNNLFEILKTYYKAHFIDNESKNMKKMCDLVKETIGGDWGKDKITDNYNQEVLCVRGADILDMDRGNKGKTPKRFILEKNVEKKQLCGNEIVIEISGGSPTQSTGRCAYITKMLESSFEVPIICTNFCRAIRLKDDKYLPSFYMNLKYLYEKNIMFLYENGTTGIKNLDLSSFLDNEEINIIEDEENQKFNNLYYNINNKMIKNAEENRILEQLRDTLLPKLMSGEINLDNVEV